MGILVGVIGGQFEDSEKHVNRMIEWLGHEFITEENRKFKEYYGDFFRVSHNESGVDDFIDCSENGKRFSYYSGYTFLRNDRPLAERLKELSKEYKDPQVVRRAHNFLRIEVDENIVEFEADVLLSTPLFYRVIGPYLVFCSELEPLAQIYVDRLTIDSKALSHFYNTGVTLPGETLFREIRMALPGKIHRFSRRPNSNELLEEQIEVKYAPPEFSNLSLTDFAKELSSMLSAAANDFVSELGVRSMSLTGGGDSRLSVAMLSEENRKKIEFFTKKSYLPSEKNYFDVELAKQITSQFGLNHEISEDRSSGTHLTNFFRRYNNSTRLHFSGVYGGELLGGLVKLAMPAKFQPETANALRGYGKILKVPCDGEASKEYYHWICSTPVLSKEYYAAILTFRGASFSSIYEGDPHWSCPALNSSWRFSIFNMGEILWELCHIPFEYIDNYLLYTEIYKTVDKGFVEIPFNSPIAQVSYSTFKHAKQHIEVPKEKSKIKNEIHLMRTENLVGNPLINEAAKKIDLFTDEFEPFMNDILPRQQQVRAIQMILFFKSFGPHREKGFLKKITDDIESRLNNF